MPHRTPPPPPPPSPPPSPPPAPDDLQQCRRCDLWRQATQAVGGAGPAHAPMMVVGEQPGDQEDLAGLPFVGPAGHLLDALFAEAGVDRAGVYVTNAVKHFKWEPRGKRRLHKTPAQQEIDACRYWLDGELARVRPRVVVALGSTALKAVTGNPHATLRQAMGQPQRHQGRWIVAVYHPSFVLRVPGAQAKQDARAQLVAGLREAVRLLRAPDAGV
ncbi:UdgX family uracil-DNA binding protein [Rugamonas brunnea]|nr:UdgX family uracil-DNA binding protein [Rugamonas brunnea]